MDADEARAQLSLTNLSVPVSACLFGGPFVVAGLVFVWLARA